jgi:hypothetical protein
MVSVYQYTRRHMPEDNNIHSFTQNDRSLERRGKGEVFELEMDSIDTKLNDHGQVKSVRHTKQFVPF